MSDKVRIWGTSLCSCGRRILSATATLPRLGNVCSNCNQWSVYTQRLKWRGRSPHYVTIPIPPATEYDRPSQSDYCRHLMSALAYSHICWVGALTVCGHTLPALLTWCTRYMRCRRTSNSLGTGKLAMMPSSVRICSAANKDQRDNGGGIMTGEPVM